MQGAEASTAWRSREWLRLTTKSGQASLLSRLEADLASPGPDLLQSGLRGVKLCSRQMIALGQVKGQPAATNMKEMVWDEELAVIAQRWADQCMPGHDHRRNVGERGVV